MKGCNVGHGVPRPCLAVQSELLIGRAVRASGHLNNERACAQIGSPIGCELIKAVANASTDTAVRYLSLSVSLIRDRPCDKIGVMYAVYGTLSLWPSCELGTESRARGRKHLHKSERLFQTDSTVTARVYSIWHPSQ